MSISLGAAARRLLQRGLAVLALCACGWPAQAAEGDVHFGLTKFLALQAGFEAGQADAIALGNQRVESGDMQFVALLFDYACLGRDVELAKDVALRSYPASTLAPAPPAQRAVTAGSDAARKEVLRLDTVKSSQGGFLLYELGQALHVLQDSYSHEGVPDVPQFGTSFSCDPDMAWAHPRSRGGWASHDADLTSRWPAESLQMAKATYEALLRYLPIGTTQRKPVPWEKVQPVLDGFIKASTKTEKQKWFAAQGIADASFLAGTSLKDGAQPFTLEWGGRRLPKLPALQSRQHDTDPGVLDFFNRFFVAWLTRDDLDKVAEEQGLHMADAKKTGDKAELAARLQLWRMRDHGAAAELAHAQGRLTPRQLRMVADQVKAPDALARYAQPAEALFPLVTNGKFASPLLPFIVRKAPPSSTGHERVVAMAKLRHAPYDTVGVVAENVDGKWAVLSIVSVVDH